MTTYLKKNFFHKCCSIDVDLHYVKRYFSVIIQLFPAQFGGVVISESRTYFVEGALVLAVGSIPSPIYSHVVHLPVSC